MAIDYCYDQIRDLEWEDPPALVERYRTSPTVFVDIDGWEIALDIKCPPRALQSASAQGTTENEFLNLAETWSRDTEFISSTPKKVLHESYQRIMAMGPDVVPFLLRDLQKNRRSWFWALRHLTQANPVPVEDQGNLDMMIAAWVTWGKHEGKI